MPAMARYDPSVALIVVDVQNDFGHPDGSLAVRGADRILPVVNRAVADAAASGAVVVYTQDWHPPSTPHFAKDGGIWPVHCVADSWGARLLDGLSVVAEYRVRKGSHGEDGYSGFTMRDPSSGAEAPTELAALLREHEIRRVVICGLATDYCVKATALDALRLGFDCSVLTDGIAAVDLAEGDGDRAIEAMSAAGVALRGG